MNQALRINGDNIRLAIFAIICAVLALSLGDAMIKQFSADFALWQIFVLRSLISVPVLVVFIKTRRRFISLLPVHIGWTALRSMMLTFQWVAYYIALPHVELSIAAAGFYTLPLFIALFAALFVGEEVGFRGWIAVFLGFGGVLLVLRPQADDFNAYALLPLIAAVLYAGAMILTRTKCRDEIPLILSFSLNVTMFVVGLMATALIWVWNPSETVSETYRYLLGSWSFLGFQEWMMMGGLAAAIIIGSVGAAIAYQAGPSSVVAPYDFFYVGFATVWGIVFFSEIPDTMTAAGMGLIVAAGVLSIQRKS
ncbi:MAG: DMT family transporter [Rhodospirillales bacterium]|nr:DMT family transporter [Rhodospirillales bacterium]